MLKFIQKELWRYFFMVKQNKQTLEVSNNILNIKYENNVLKSYKLVSISSDKYDLTKDDIVF